MFRSLILAGLCAAFAPAPALAQSAPVEQGAPNVPSFSPAFPNQTRAPAMAPVHNLRTGTFVSGLKGPWGIDTLPGGQGFLVTEKPGRLRHIGLDGTKSDPIAGVPEVVAAGQGGLLDVAIGPDFASDRRVYMTYSKRVGGGYVTAAARGVLSEDMTQLTQVEDIFVQTPPSAHAKHYGSRILFDGQGHAFITTGEHSAMEDRGKAQDLGTTYGKIVRINLDGSVPASNPFTDRPGAEPEIWSFGHRNIQGAFMDGAQLWIIEHGPKGGDELNLIRPGRNYGWPVISYGERYSGAPIGSGESKREGMEQPVYYWDPVIAPAGMVQYDATMFANWRDDVLISSLSPGGIVRLRLENDRVTGEERLLGDLGRVRDIEVAPDGSLLVLRDSGTITRVSRQQ